MDYRVECPNVSGSLGSADRIVDPDLLMLREDIADELGAIVGYRECAERIRNREVSQRFSEAANDETGHFILLMRMVAQLDPVQAEELRSQQLPFLVMNPVVPPGFSPCGQCGNAAEDDERYDNERRHSNEERRHYREDEAIECLRNAIRDELHAINAYQRQLETLVNPAAQSLVAKIMNKEKEHVAEFTRLFNEIFHLC